MSKGCYLAAYPLNDSFFVLQFVYSDLWQQCLGVVLRTSDEQSTHHTSTLLPIFGVLDYVICHLNQEHLISLTSHHLHSL